FTDIFIAKGKENSVTKTDWAGLFAEDEIFWQAPAFGKAEPIRLAFNAFSMNDAWTGGNPLKLEIVINQGGGRGPADVNVYSPRIHEYNCGAPTFAADGTSVFYVSTCDTAIMSAHMADGSCTGGPPCTSSADTFEQLIVHPLMLMAEQLSAVMMQQMLALGSMIDAKDQNEAQRDFRHLVAQAHKDYHPSEQMCRFGSYVRSISHAEESAEATAQAFNQKLSTYARMTENMSSAEGYALDMESRIEQFKDHYCNPNDNNGALWIMCRGEAITMPAPASAGNEAVRERFNKDIDYFNTLGNPLTLNVDTTASLATNDEEDLMALAKNLYWPQIYSLANEEQYDEGFLENYPLLMNTRNIVGKLSIAHNSFANIVGMKSQSQNPLAATSGSAHLKALLREFGLTDPDIELLVGNNPSYYAQMEILAKKIYQNPTFYTNLYDKPANIDRINASMEAFQNMHMRDRFESQLRQEMLISMLTEEAIMERVREINSRLPVVSANRPKTRQGTGF
ncbi:MAG: hypothetical protein ACLFR0_03640, partial [Alphaproteobacteria bacterium]